MIAPPASTPIPARVFAAAGALIAIAAAVGAIALRLLDPVPVVPNPLGFGDVALIGFEVMGVAFASVGALLVVRRPRNAVGWLMVVIGIGQAGSGLGAAVTYAAVALGTDASLRLAELTAWLSGILTTAGALVLALPFIFPTGRFQSRAWATVAGMMIGPGILIPLMLAIQPGPFYLLPSLTNPFGVGPDIRSIVGAADSVVVASSVAPVAVLIVLAFTSRYRSAGIVERDQLKWFMLASVASVAGILVAATGAIVSNGSPGEAGIAMFGIGGALVPVAIGIAILRRGLYDIDRIIGRTVAYGVVTAILAGAFAIATLTLQGVLAPLTGGQTIAVAASTLLVFVLFQPLRSRAQKTLDRRFDRERYDAERTLDALAERLRSDMDLESIGLDVVGVLRGTFHPSIARIWIRPNVTDRSHTGIS